MNILEGKIIPFYGLSTLKLLDSIDDIKKTLKREKIKFTEEFQSNKGCTPEVPWEIIHIEESITLTFAKKKLWQIYLENKFLGILPNGIKLGMKMEEACKIDATLKFDEWNEEFISDNGYWLEDDLTNNTVMSITIFIKEAENDEEFFKYNW